MLKISAGLSDDISLLEYTHNMRLDDIMTRVVAATATALNVGWPLLLCGNVGSTVDAQHIVGEMVGRFLMKRRALEAISLRSNPAVPTDWSYNNEFETVFNRQVEAYGETGGVLLGISMSSNSRNVVLALEAARARDNNDQPDRGGQWCDGTSGGLSVRGAVQFRPAIQEADIVAYHYFCAAVEAILA